MKMSDVSQAGIRCPYCSHNTFDYPARHQEATKPFFGFIRAGRELLPERIELTCKMCRGESYVLPSDMAMAIYRIREK